MFHCYYRFHIAADQQTDKITEGALITDIHIIERTWTKIGSIHILKHNTEYKNIKTSCM